MANRAIFKRMYTFLVTKIVTLTIFGSVTVVQQSRTTPVLRRWGRMFLMIKLTLYGKPDCPLCDEMKEALDRVGRVVPIEVTYTDISSNPELTEKYRYDIPVLTHEGTELARHRFRDEVMVKKLEKIIG